MSDSTTYTLRWRGRQMGPYSIGKINRMLEEHELGMGHEILYENKWMSLEQFFALLPKATEAGGSSRAAVPPLAHHGPAEGFSVPPLLTAPPATPSSAALRPPVAAAASPAAAGLPVAGEVQRIWRLVFALLAVFLGFLGVHNFYALRWPTGLLQLLLSAATYLLGFGIIAPWLWAIVEAVVVRRDGAGREMI